MDTKLTKNYTIIFLVILNIFLFCVGAVSKDRYKITRNQESSVIDYLENRDIVLNTSLPKFYEPMSNINMKSMKNDDLLLQKLFFGDTQHIEVKEKFDSVIFEQNDKMMILNDMYIYFENLEINPSYDGTEKYARQIIEPYREGLENIYGKLYREKIEQKNGKVTIDYIQKVNGYKNFNNIAHFIVNQDGAFSLNFNSYEKVKNTGAKMNIYSADEAIYSFAREIRNLVVDEKIFINYIDLGYYINNSSEDIYFTLTPYYRIYIDDNDIPFYIDAYTNEFKYNIMIPIKQFANMY